MPTTFENLTDYSHAVADAVAEGERAYNGYREDSCSLGRHLDRIGERPLWLPVPGLHTSTYGADANTHYMIETNENAAIELCNEREVDYGYIQGAQLAVLVADEGETSPREDALGLLTELVESLENYPLLDDEAYSTACWESAAEDADREIMEAARELLTDENIADRIADEFGDDVRFPEDAFLAALYAVAGTQHPTTGAWIGHLWEEQECYPHVDSDAVRECILLAYPATDPDHWERCRETAEMF